MRKDLLNHVITHLSPQVGLGPWSQVLNNAPTLESWAPTQAPARGGLLITVVSLEGSALRRGHGHTRMNPLNVNARGARSGALAGQLKSRTVPLQALIDVSEPNRAIRPAHTRCA